jgi:hypothetical protein
MHWPVLVRRVRGDCGDFCGDYQLVLSRQTEHALERHRLFTISYNVVLPLPKAPFVIMSPLL